MTQILLQKHIMSNDIKHNKDGLEEQCKVATGPKATPTGTGRGLSAHAGVGSSHKTIRGPEKHFFQMMIIPIIKLKPFLSSHWQ